MEYNHSSQGRRIGVIMSVFCCFLAMPTIALAAPEIISPIPDSQLETTIATFEWTPNELPVSFWMLSIGSKEGDHDIFTQGFEKEVRAITVNNLPDDGRKLYVRLRYRVRNQLQHLDVIYTATEPLREFMGEFASIRKELESLKAENENLKSRIGRVEQSQVDLIFGEPVLAAPNTTHKAEKNGFVQAWTGGSIPSGWNLYSDKNRPPVTQLARITDQHSASAGMLVRKGDYWAVKHDRETQRGAVAVYFTPILTSLKFPENDAFTLNLNRE